MHNSGANVAVLSTLFPSLRHMESRVASRVSLGSWSPARSRDVQDFPRFGWCVRGRLFWQLSVETRFACCRPDSSRLPMDHTEQPIFAIVPNLVLVQLLGQFPELLIPSSRSRNVAILVPSHSSH